MPDAAPDQDVDLSVVIPAYNEEDRLPPSLVQMADYLAHSPLKSELIVVDDGSSDATVTRVEALQAEGIPLTLIRHPVNRGKGAAVATGVLASKGEYVLFTDADLSTPPEDVEALLAALRAGADLAIGSRALDRTLTQVHQPWMRDRMGRVFNMFVQAIVLPGLQDTQCGFKAFRGDLGRQIFAEMESTGFEFDVELLYRARRLGAVIKEIPVHWRNSADTRVSAVRDSSKMFVALFRIRRKVH